MLLLSTILSVLLLIYGLGAIWYEGRTEWVGKKETRTLLIMFYMLCAVIGTTFFGLNLKEYLGW